MRALNYFCLRGKFSSFYLIFCFCISSIPAKTQLQFNAILSNLDKPVGIVNAADNSGRLFLVEQTGKVKIYRNGIVSPRPFIDLTNLVDIGRYRGLWSIAFPPAYKNNGFFFVYYNDTSGNTIVARYRTSATNPDSAIANSGVILFSVPVIANSVGPYFGEMHFGKDGYLYITMNDGSFMARNTRWAQNGTVFLGKMLRLNINKADAPYYSIPPDNPFINNPNVQPEIFASGFRNAWRWSFDRISGNIFLADVGADQMEEVDLISPTKQIGANFGWPCYEGTIPFMTTDCGARNNYTFPIFTYRNDAPAGGNCIIGGYIYRGAVYPWLTGKYICSDYISNNAWIINRSSTGSVDVQLQTGIPAEIECYGEDEAGELYAASLDGTIYSLGVTPTLSANQSQSQLKASTQNTDLNVRSRLDQNVPNPSTGSTTIGYYIPTATGSAYINFFTSSGVLLRSFKLDAKGSGTIHIKAGELAAGTYQYALIIDGKVIDTKQMVQKD